ncbi:MAG: hypothetical protein LUD47_06165 [Clostridia bacterium]|nr:hypothetical protein [Clostridia bacterium]
MSLLDDEVFCHSCTRLVEKKTQSSEGGWTTEWADGDVFTCHQAIDTSSEAQRAEQQGVASLYSGLINKDVELNYGDYFRDDAIGVTYRVTSIPAEKQAPVGSSFPLKYFTAERKVPPT